MLERVAFGVSIGVFILIVLFGREKPERYKECRLVPSVAFDHRLNKTRVRVVSFNAHWLFDGVGDRIPPTPELAQQHMKKIAQQIRATQADIVVLQEVESCGVLYMLSKMLEQEKYEPYLLAGFDRATRQQMGLLTKVSPTSLSRVKGRIPYPISGTQCSAAARKAKGKMQKKKKQKQPKGRQQQQQHDDHHHHKKKNNRNNKKKKMKKNINKKKKKKIFAESNSTTSSPSSSPSRLLPRQFRHRDTLSFFRPRPRNRNAFTSTGVSKGLQMHFRLSTFSLRILGVHLKSGRNLQDCMKREAQATLVASAASSSFFGGKKKLEQKHEGGKQMLEDMLESWERRGQEDVPVMVLGDFNEPRGEATWNRLTSSSGSGKSFLVDLCGKTERAEMEAEGRRPIDHILGSRLLVNRVVSCSFDRQIEAGHTERERIANGYSDHWPLVIELKDSTTSDFQAV